MTKQKKYKKNFDKLISKLNQRLEELNSQDDYSYDDEDPNNQALLANRRGFNHDSIEHTEHASIVLVPEWATSPNFFKEGVAEKLFEEFYANNTQSKPRTMWQAPLVLKFFYHEHDYKISMIGEEDITNSITKFISYDEALEKFAAQQELNKAMQQLAKDLLKKHRKEFHRGQESKND